MCEFSNKLLLSSMSSAPHQVARANNKLQPVRVSHVCSGHEGDHGHGHAISLAYVAACDWVLVGWIDFKLCCPLFFGIRLLCCTKRYKPLHLEIKKQKGPQAHGFKIRT